MSCCGFGGLRLAVRSALPAPRLALVLVASLNFAYRAPALHVALETTAALACSGCGFPLARPLLAHGVSRRADPVGRPLSARALELRLRHASGGLRPAIQPRLGVEHVVHGGAGGASSSAWRRSSRGAVSPSAGAGRSWSTASTLAARASPDLLPMVVFPSLLPNGIASSVSTRRRAPEPGRRLAARARAALPPGGTRLCATQPADQRRVERLARDRMHPLRCEPRQLLLPSGGALELGLHR